MSEQRKPLIMEIEIPYCIAPERFARRQQLTGTNAEKNAYMAALKKELLLYADNLEGYEIRALRLKGGACTVMSPDLLGDLLKTARTNLPVSPRAEVSVDAHPVTIGTPALTGISQGRPNRMELMMRSSDDEELKALGCVHTMQHVNQAILFFNRFRMNNFGLTVNYGIPGQTETSWLNTLHACTIIHPAHITIEAVSLTEEAAQEMTQAGKTVPDAQMQYAMYEDACRILQENGYIHYGAGQFCLPQHGHLYELLRTEGTEYVGIGLGAHTLLDGYLTRNTNNLQIYLSGADDFGRLTAETFKADTAYMMTDYIQSRLLSTEGLHVSVFREKFGCEMPEDLKKALQGRAENGLLRVEEDKYIPTTEGLFEASKRLAV